LTANQRGDKSKSRLLVLGDGGWGTAIALTLCSAGHDVRLWSHESDYAAEMKSTRLNRKFLPGVTLPEGLTISSEVDKIGEEVDAIFVVIPTQFLRQTVTRLKSTLPRSVPLISCSKGIERNTLLLPTDILRQSLTRERITVLSGPSHAEEVSRRLPTTVVAASHDLVDAVFVQNLFMNTRLRVYTSRDFRGVELGGAVKNVIAIAAGISDGLGFGDNSRAAIVTRGLVEITRLGVALGAKKETFSGLSGMGDLITTCTSRHSRNWTVGYRVGRGEKLSDILASTTTVAEGVETSRSVFELNKSVGVEMPISREVYAVLHENKSAKEAVGSLMSRTAKHESEDLV
jgi:glycerol-3-phosphate dehydrogenase (NAD(P)+)